TSRSPASYRCLCVWTRTGSEHSSRSRNTALRSRLPDTDVASSERYEPVVVLARRALLLLVQRVPIQPTNPTTRGLDFCVSASAASFRGSFPVVTDTVVVTPLALEP